MIRLNIKGEKESLCGTLFFTTTYLVQKSFVIIDNLIQLISSGTW